LKSSREELLIPSSREASFVAPVRNGTLDCSVVHGEGPKPPLLLIAGWAGVKDDWGAFPKLIKDRPVITFSPRYLGFSEQQDSDEVLSVASMAEGKV